MRKIAVFASGSGTNTENIICSLKGKNEIIVALVATNNPNAYVLKRAENHSIPTALFTREMFRCGEVLTILKEHKIDYIVLAGFLLLVPKYLTEAYAGRIINIHPALLPKFGGKGMYGDNVHRAVKESGEKETGITIHQVNENFDSGDIIFQARCVIEEKDNVEEIANKVHKLEYLYYPTIIEEEIKKLNL